MKKDEIVKAVFASDAYALSCHWLYERKEIDAVGRTRSLHRAHAQFHDKEKGELTHYGDHVLHLLRYLAEEGRFDAKSYATKWQIFFERYSGYRDHASKLALKRLKKDPDSLRSERSRAVDLVSAVRFAPLLLCARSEPAEVREWAVQESALTYAHPLIDECLEGFFDMLDRVASGTHPLEAARAYVSASKNDFSAMLAEGLQSAHMNTQDAVEKFGSACGIDGGAQIIGHLLVKYPDNPVQALEENLFSGGDTAARALGYTMLQASYRGLEAVDISWYQGLLARDEIDRAISAAPLLR